MDPTTEIITRVAAVAILFAGLATWEVLAPRRRLVLGRRRRWPGNIGIVIIDALAVRLLIPTAAVGFALLASERGWGLFNLLAVPGWIAGIVGFILLDLIIYAQHVVFHYVPVLWRLHRMHHADLELDLTTGVRFHPVEILLSMLIKIAAVVALGIPALAVVAFEVVLNATSMFNHSNIAMPERIDRVVRWLVVTPDMHHVHHSIETRETNSNFGFNLPWWDRVFGTYRQAAAAGKDGLVIGIPIFRDPGELRLDRLLTQPFRRGSRGDQADAATAPRTGALAESGRAGSANPS